MRRAKPSGPRLWLSACICALLVSHAAELRAQPSRDELAESHFRSGAAYLEESDYENALRAFEKAYELSNRPELLLNIATVRERMNQLEPAVMALEQYLRVDPQGRHVETVQRRIDNLKRRIEAQPTTPEADAPASPPTPAKTEAAPRAPEPSPPPPPPTATERPPSKVPVFIAFGVASLSAAGAIVTGALAQAKHTSLEEECAPHCSDDSLRTGKTLAWTSTALTGAAIVAAGVGVTLLLLKRRPSEATAAGARLELKAGARGVGLTANVHF